MIEKVYGQSWSTCIFILFCKNLFDLSLKNIQHWHSSDKIKFKIVRSTRTGLGVHGKLKLSDLRTQIFHILVHGKLANNSTLFSPALQEYMSPVHLCWLSVHSKKSHDCCVSSCPLEWTSPSVKHETFVVNTSVFSRLLMQFCKLWSIIQLCKHFELLWRRLRLCSRLCKLSSDYVAEHCRSHQQRVTKNLVTGMKLA